jgi:hypothetical protein
MARNTPIYKRVDDLDEQNMTTRVLHTLDFAVPGKWENLVGFEQTITSVTGESDPQMVKKIGERAITLYNDKQQGYQRAMGLYSAVDRIDKKLASVALANTVGGQVRWLRFLERITPKDDKVQGLDLSLKLAAELAAFCLINGIPGDSIGDFVKALGEYGKDSRMRMVALASLDGVVPFGSDFLDRAVSILNSAGADDLQQNKLYQSVEAFLPGTSPAEKKSLIEKNFDATRGWMQDLVSQSGLTQDNVIDSLSSVVDMTDRKMDYLAAFLDMTTDYFEHTGTQTLARRLIERAVNEI